MAGHHEAGKYLPLHPLDFRILLAVLDEPSYGSRIVAEIEAQATVPTRIYPANLFRRIRDLLAKGLLAESPTPDGADSRRTYVQLTSLGRAVAVAEGVRLRELLSEAERRALPSGA